MHDDDLNKIMDEVEREFGCSGLAGSTLYGEFALEVARRAVSKEREASAKVCAEVAAEYVARGWEYSNDLANVADECEERIRIRSNV